MPRAQDLLDEAISITKTAAAGLPDAGLTERAETLTAHWGEQREKFFFKSLAGVPLANKAKKAALALADGGGEAAVAALEALAAEIDEKSDAPGTVLT
ncbi:MAG: hypothetical protein V3S18_03875 [Dehalococcoidia bacterium]